MPDLMNLTITRNGNVNVSVPRYNITCDVIDSTSKTLLRSFNVNFPNLLANLSNAQLDNLFEQFILMIINKKINDNTA